jgi:hypothetical protein
MAVRGWLKREKQLYPLTQPSAPKAIITLDGIDHYRRFWSRQPASWTYLTIVMVRADPPCAACIL